MNVMCIKYGCRVPIGMFTSAGKHTHTLKKKDNSHSINIHEHAMHTVTDTICWALIMFSGPQDSAYLHLEPQQCSIKSVMNIYVWQMALCH